MSTTTKRPATRASSATTRRATRVPALPSPEFFHHAATIFQSLSEPTRLKILMALKLHTTLTVAEIVQHCTLSQPLVSKHLKILRHAGLIVTQRAGTSLLVSLQGDLVDQLCDTVCQTLNNNADSLATAARHGRSVAQPKRRA